MRGGRPVVCLDVDGVLADFMRGFVQLANQMFGRAIPEAWVPQAWDQPLPGLSRIEESQLWAVIRSSVAFWQELPVLASREDLEVIRRTSAVVYYVTSREGVNPRRDTALWLRRYVDATPHVLVSRRKGEVVAGLEADYFLDDKAGHAVVAKYLRPDCQVYLLDRPYNQFSHEVVGRGVRRVGTVKAFFDAVEAGE